MIHCGSQYRLSQRAPQNLMRLPWDIDDQMKFEFIEPSKDTFLFSDKFLECFMLLFSFDVAAADEG